MVFLKYMIKRLCVFFLILFALSGILAHADDLNSEFSFAVIGDTQPAKIAGGIPDIFTKAIEKINTAKVDFVVQVGDAIYLGMNDTNISSIENQWKAFKNEIAKLAMPFYKAPGNEDIWNALSQDHYKKLFSEKLYYSFDHKNSHFVILDTELAGSRGSIPEAERAWLENDLRTTSKENIFVFLHRPVTSRRHPMPLEERSQQYLKDLFSKYKVRGVFSGHEHLYHKESYGNVDYYITGGGGARLYDFGVGGSFYHFLVITVKSGSVKVDVVKIP
jgi:3',5'-cyclic AMP phosphodiesterase CpdA